MGRFCVEGVLGSPSPIENLPRVDVPLLPLRADYNCSRSRVLELETIAGFIQGGFVDVPKKPVVVVGSINIDLVSTADRIPAIGETISGKNFQIHPGGKGANQAVAVGRLGYPVRMIGRLGNDAFGQQLRVNLESAGVDVAGVMTSEGTSGVAVILVGGKGENSIVITAGANALLSPQDLNANIDILRSAGLVLTQLETPLETVEYLAHLCAREGIPLILDPAPAGELPRDLFRSVDWFTPNETEAAFFLGNSNDSTETYDPSKVARTLIGKGVKGVVLKLGSRGAYLDCGNGEAQSIDPFLVNAIDTTAAGDAFNGAFATALMLGKGPTESARFASAAAAISVTRAGAQPSMPTMTELEQLLDQEKVSDRPGAPLIRIE
jgi:ribokinase